MDNFGEVLTGHCVDQLLPYAIDPITGIPVQAKPPGNNGLTSRVFAVNYLWGLTESLRRPRLRRFGLKFPLLFDTFAGTVNVTSMTEFLRIMDRKESPAKGGLRDNLTVALCHDRFQKNSSMAAKHAEEDRRFKALEGAYNLAGLRDFRNQEMFHVDLQTALLSFGGRKDVDVLTDKLVDWYTFVAPCHYGNTGISDQVIDARPMGKKSAKELRVMLTTYWRAQSGNLRRAKRS